MATRRRAAHTKTFQERLVEEAKRFRDEAAKLGPGLARELLLRHARLAETASQPGK
jgi:hypothetical protein